MRPRDCLSAWQCDLYATPRTLWADTVAKNPESWLAHNNLGVLLAQDGELEAALVQYQEATRLQPSSPETYLNIGNVLQANGKLEEAANCIAWRCGSSPRIRWRTTTSG